MGNHWNPVELIHLKVLSESCRKHVEDSEWVNLIFSLNRSILLQEGCHREGEKCEKNITNLRHSVIGMIIELLIEAQKRSSIDKFNSIVKYCMRLIA